MKNNFHIALLALLPCLKVSAQPTITSADLPVAGLAFTVIQDSTYIAPVPAGGANVTWDYSGLQNLLTDTIGFVASAGTPYASSFPGSNLASQADNLTDWTYSTTNSSGFYIDGGATPSFILRYNPPTLFIPVPFTYNQTRSNIARFVQDTAFVDTTGTPRNLRFILNIQSNFLSDGYGSLILPNGTFNNILRIRNTEIVYDSLLVELFPGNWLPVSSSASQTTYYRYFEAGSASSYILGIEADSLGINSVSSEYRGQWVLLNTPVIASPNLVSVYPNPANQYFSVSGEMLTQRSRLLLIDASGKTVYDQPLRNPDMEQIPVDGLAEGLYQLLLYGEGGSQTVRVMVRH